MIRLSIALLGPMVVMLDDQPVSFGYEKLRALLAYLSLEAAQPVRRGKLAGLLWPDQTDQAAQDSLRQALSRLRLAIGDRQSAQPVLRVERDTVQMPPSAQVWVDANIFQGALARTSRHAHRHPQACEPCTQQRRLACDIYRGAFLADLSLPDSDLFEEWAAAQREAFCQQAVDAFTHLVDYDERKANDAAIHQNVPKWLKIDPWNEAAHGAWMRLMARNGQRSEAIGYYQQVRKTLKNELGIEPSKTLANLNEQLKGDTAELLQSLSPRRPAGLPTPLTPLVGRRAELIELQAWLADPTRRLITITGPGGIGKTRLLIATVEQQAAAFRDGAAYINLAGAQDACEALAKLVANTLHVNTSLTEDLSGKDFLLALDSFEYCPGGRSQVQEWLETCPGLVVLTASRQRLGMPGEWVFGLGGLEVPPPAMAANAEQYSAVNLFVNRAQQVAPGFELDAHNRAIIGDICRLVDGFPLAINLAAAWVAAIPCAQIDGEIRRSLDILSNQTGPEDIHHSVRAVFDQSWGRLTDTEQQTFARLSVFRGGFDRPAAHAVAGADLGQLTILIEKSFLRGSPEGRYDLHDLLRQYGAEKLANRGETQGIRQRHFQYYFQVTRRSQPDFQNPVNFQAFHWLVREQQNLQAALEWALEHEEPVIFQELERRMHSDFHGYGVHRVSGKPAQG